MITLDAIGVNVKDAKVEIKELMSDMDCCGGLPLKDGSLIHKLLCPSMDTGVMIGWQPIETAPKRGPEAEILLFDQDGCTWVGYYEADDGMWHEGGGSHEVFPTHWMPLPEPPTV